VRFFLTAADIENLLKVDASSSGAAANCEREVALAASMAARALVAALGGSNDQVAHAAGIALERTLESICNRGGGRLSRPQSN
jgi:L-serine dehydratase